MTSRRKRTFKDPALVMVAASEGDANMLYATRFFVPDPFIFFQHRGRKYAVMSDLELDRAKKQAHVDRVLSLSSYQRRLRELGRNAGITDVLESLFREMKIHSLLVPANFPTQLADQIRARGFDLGIKEPFFPEREKKKSDEVKSISNSLR